MDASKRSFWEGVSEQKKTFFIVALFSVAAAFYQALAPGLTAPLLDDLHYLNTAFKLIDIGVFTRIGSDNAPANFVGPLYVGLLSLIAILDEHFFSMLTCLAGATPTTCSLDGLLSLVIVQAIIGAATYVFVFYVIEQLSQKRSISYLTLFFVIISGAYGEYFSLALTETLTFFLLAATLYLWLRLITSSQASLVIPLLLGLTLGLATLARPSSLYLSVALLIVFCAFGWSWQKRPAFQLLKQVIVSGVVYVLVISPWLIRNYYQFGNLELTGDYGKIVLAQRLGYNAMTWAEYWVSYVYWAPKIGEPLANLLFDKELYSRLGWVAPESFFRVWAKGENTAYLIEHYIIGDLFKHVAVSITIAIRGMWAGGYMSVLGLLCLAPTMLAFYKEKRLGVFLLFLFPAFFMLGFHAFVSANMVRYNIPLTIIYAYCFSHVLLSYARRYSMLLTKFF